MSIIHDEEKSSLCDWLTEGRMEDSTPQPTASPGISRRSYGSILVLFAIVALVLMGTWRASSEPGLASLPQVDNMFRLLTDPPFAALLLVCLALIDMQAGTAEVTEAVRAIMLLVGIALTYAAIGELSLRNELTAFVASELNLLKSSEQHSVEATPRSAADGPKLSATMRTPADPPARVAFDEPTRADMLNAVNKMLQYAAIAGTPSTNDDYVSFSRVVALDTKFPILMGKQGNRIGTHTDDALRSMKSYRSDTILCVGIISAAIIGGVIAGMRVSLGTSLLHMAEGLSGGFIIFLLIRTGNGTLLSRTGFVEAHDPYGCALLGLFAGLFSRKSYDTLDFFAQELLERLRGSGRRDSQETGVLTDHPPAHSLPAPPHDTPSTPLQAADQRGTSTDGATETASSTSARSAH